MKKILLFAGILCSFAAYCADDGLIFHFDFKDAANKTAVTDKTGKFTAKVETGRFAVQSGALRTAIGAKIYIPDNRKAETVSSMTVMGWILKKSTPEVTPILMKGEHPYNMQFLFSVGWRYPVFCYKNQPRQKGWKGIWYKGVFGSGIHYPDKSWIKPGTKLIESSGYWRHIAAVFDRGIVRIYLDGRLSMEKVSEKGNLLAANSQPFWIGAERATGENTSTATADMLLNDLRLYSKALSEAEINAVIRTETQKYPKGNLIPRGETHINALAPCYSYLPPEYDLAMERDLPVTREFERSKRTPEDFSKGITVERKMVQGLPALFINGKRQIPMQGIANLQDGLTHKVHFDRYRKGIRNFAAAGINLANLPVGTNNFWKGEKQYEWNFLDRELREAVKGNPNVKLMVYIHLIPPNWFIRQYPDELEQSYFGKDLRKQLSAGPLGSDLWLKVTEQMLRDLVLHFESIPEGKHIYAYLIGGGQSAEWYWPASVYGGIPGFSEGTRKSFRRWLKEKYKNDAALQKAWNNSGVTLNNADVPSVNARRAAECGLFRDPQKGACVIDFRRYMTDQTLLHIKRTTEAVKAATGGKKFTVIYSGYDLPVASAKLFQAGLCGTWNVFQMPSVDMVCTPIDYGRRRGGNTGVRVNAFDGSARLAEKILWQEDDPRTHLCLFVADGRSANLQETLEVQKRSTAQAITRGTAVWWLLFNNAWFHQDEIIRTLKKNVELHRKALQKPRKVTAQAAIVFDEDSHYLLSDSRSSFLQFHTWETYENAVRSGIMFDYYYQKDLMNPKMPSYKLYIFLTSYSVNAEQRAKIHAKLAKDGATAVWCYAPGFFDGNKMSLENMKQLTGFNFRMIRSQGNITSTTVRLPDYGFIPGQSLAADPKFFVTDPALITLAEGGIFAEKKMGKWISIYSLMPMSRLHLRAIGKKAGLHIYSDSDDEIFANSDYLMLHSCTAGDKMIRLPGKFNVTELYSGKNMGKGIRQFTDKDVAAGVTKLYRLEK